MLYDTRRAIITEKQLGVYVQALPVSLSNPSSTKKFEEQFKDSDFVLSHSSKIALKVAKSLGYHEVCAFGHSSILHEALARGATSAYSVPLFVNVVDQARSIPRDHFSSIVLPENLDGPFTGASLAGALISLYGLSFALWDGANRHPESRVILVKDIDSSDSIDVRRISQAVATKVETSTVIGQDDVATSSMQGGARHEELTGSMEEISGTIAKRLRRLVANPDALESA